MTTPKPQLFNRISITLMVVSSLLINVTTQVSLIMIVISSILIDITAQASANNLYTVPSASTSHASNEMSNIVEIAASNPNFKTLVAAIQAADLTDTLSGNTEFTVFAPTDEAFAKLPQGTLEKLLKPENKSVLQQILTYHVVSGTVTSQSLKSGRVKTVEGNPVHVVVNQKDGIIVNESRVIQTDIKASNGIIHVIDTVLIPPGF